MLLDWPSLSGSVGRQAGETVEHLVQRGFVKVKHTHMRESMCTYTHTSQGRGGRQSHSVRGKNTEIKRCVLVVFNLACWQPSNSPVVTLDNFTTLVSAAWDRDQDRHPLHIQPIHTRTHTSSKIESGRAKWLLQMFTVWSIISNTHCGDIMELLIM